MPINLIEFFAGAGTLTRALIDGLSLQHEVRVAGCVELGRSYLAHWAGQHPEASTVAGSLNSYSPEELSFPDAAGFTILVAGIPCTGASLAGRSKNGIGSGEEHDKVGHLFLPVAHWIRRHRPQIVIFENVPQYQKSLSGRLLRQALRTAGYGISEWVLNSRDFGSPTERKRWALVAQRGARTLAWTPAQTPFTGTLGDFLDKDGDAESFSVEQVAAHDKYLARKQAEGCGWRKVVIDDASTKCPTICRTYAKVQPVGPFVKTKISYRMLRPREIARIHGFPDSFALPEAKTTATEVLGQGVVYQPFAALGNALGGALQGSKTIPAGQMEMIF